MLTAVAALSLLASCQAPQSTAPVQRQAVPTVHHHPAPTAAQRKLHSFDARLEQIQRELRQLQFQLGPHNEAEGE